MLFQLAGSGLDGGSASFDPVLEQTKACTPHLTTASSGLNVVVGAQALACTEANKVCTQAY